MNSIPFHKLEALGNDFIVVDGLVHKSINEKLITPELARNICDRRYGVGGDQLIWLHPSRSDAADAVVAIINVDGTVAEMCGNGLRAVGLHLFKRGRQTGQKRYVVETLAGLKTIEISTHGKDIEISIDLGTPRFINPQTETIELNIDNQKHEIEFREINMGNPHAVVFVENVDIFPAEKFGSLLETHQRFPEKTNVEFVEVLDRANLKMRVWERSVGITPACGSGASAATVAAFLKGLVDPSVTVTMPGGPLKIQLQQPGHSVLMIGSAREVFWGEFLSRPLSVG